jgi:hypothetical protein
MLATRLISFGSYTFTLMNKNSSRYMPYIVFRLTTSMLCMRRRLEYELWLRFDVANLAFALLKLRSRSSNATSKLGNRLKRKRITGVKISLDCSLGGALLRCFTSLHVERNQMKRGTDFQDGSERTDAPKGMWI